MKKYALNKTQHIGLYFLLLIYLLCFSFDDTKAITKEEGITLAFQKTKALVKEVNINAHVNMGKKFIEPCEAEKLAHQIANTLNIHQPNLQNHSTKGNTHVLLNGQHLQGQNTVVIVQSIKQDDIQETHIVVDMTAQNKLIDLHQMHTKIEEALKKYGQAHFTSCITGTYNKNLDLKSREKIVKVVMDSLEAQEVEAFREDRMLSIVGFSNKIKEGISYNGKRVNLNVALRYNSYEDKTYIWLATPLITTEY